MPLAIPLITETPARTKVRVRDRVVRSQPVEFRVPTMATRGLVRAEILPIAYNEAGGEGRSISSIGYSEEPFSQQTTHGCAPVGGA
jgi:hypothetical protein